MNLCSGSVFLVVTGLASSHSHQPLPDIEVSHGAAVHLWSLVPTGGHVEGSYPLLGKDTAWTIVIGPQSLTLSSMIHFQQRTDSTAEGSRVWRLPEGWCPPVLSQHPCLPWVGNLCPALGVSGGPGRACSGALPRFRGTLSRGAADPYSMEYTPVAE